MQCSPNTLPLSLGGNQPGGNFRSFNLHGILGKGKMQKMKLTLTLIVLLTLTLNQEFSISIYV